MSIQRSPPAFIYQWAFLYGPVWFLIIFMAIAMIMVYKTVLGQEKKSTQWSFGHRQNLIPQHHGKATNSSGSREDSSVGVVVAASTSERNRPSTKSLVPPNYFRQSKGLRMSCMSDEGKEAAPSHDRSKHSRKVANQGLLYVMAFLMTWFFGTVTRILDLAKNRTYFPIGKSNCVLP